MQREIEKMTTSTTTNDLDDADNNNNNSNKNNNSNNSNKVKTDTENMAQIDDSHEDTNLEYSSCTFSRYMYDITYGAVCIVDEGILNVKYLVIKVIIVKYL